MWITKVLVLFSLICFCMAQVPPYDEVCETNKWPVADKGRVIPTYVVNLDLPPKQRWTQIVTMYKSGIQDLIKFIKHFIVEFNPSFQKLVEIVENDLAGLVSTFPAPYGEEMIGIAEATGLPLGDIVLYNIFYEVFTVCTSIVSQDTNGHMLLARNLDFGLFLGWDLQNNTWMISELLRPITVNVNFTRGKNEIQYITTGFAGFIGVFTGVKPNKYAVAMNERFAVKGGFIGLFEWIFNINRNQSWGTFLPRDVFEKNITFNEAVNDLANTPLLAPCYYIVAGPEPGNGAVVTRDREKAADVWRLNATTWFLAETNYDHWKAPLIFDDRITPANRCMNKMGQANSSFAGIFNVLSSKPVLNKLTVFTTLIDVKSGHIEAYRQFCADPCWPW